MLGRVELSDGALQPRDAFVAATAVVGAFRVTAALLLHHLPHILVAGLHES